MTEGSTRNVPQRCGTAETSSRRNCSLDRNDLRLGLRGLGRCMTLGQMTDDASLMRELIEHAEAVIANPSLTEEQKQPFREWLPKARLILDELTGSPSKSEAIH